jgi:hypothetical protein
MYLQRSCEQDTGTETRTDEDRALHRPVSGMELQRSYKQDTGAETRTKERQVVRSRLRIGLAVRTGPVLKPIGKLASRPREMRARPRSPTAAVSR